jgi:hypothetical protein
MDASKLFGLIFGLPALLLLGLGGVGLIICFAIRLLRNPWKRLARAWHAHWEARATAHLYNLVRRGKVGGL